MEDPRTKFAGHTTHEYFVLDNHLNFNYFYAMFTKFLDKNLQESTDMSRPNCGNINTDLFCDFWWWCNRCAMVRSL